ncbi:MAG: acetolactate synthase 3 large subunit [Rhodospirillaceae bacterium]|nr:acetolactate synthase 3 large subunit [Rhodospirillaceae bacterium]
MRASCVCGDRVVATSADNSGENINGSEMIVRCLAELGVEVIFGYPGGAVLPIYDAIFKQNKIRHILVRHEQGALHAAEGYARSTGRVGVVLVTSGPGATNSVTGLADALMDSIPLVCLTGQVPTHMIGNDAFQEADTVGITRPCTKHNYLVKTVEDLPRIIHEAFYIASAGRPGPVVIDLPKDVVMAEGDYQEGTYTSETGHRSYRPRTEPDNAAVDAAMELIVNAERPIFYSGGGIINSGPAASEALTRFVRETGYPITNTLMGLGTYPASDAQFLGMLGMHGTYEANMAMAECDVMIALGARFDDRVTGRLSDFSKGSKKIQVDIDPSSVNKNVPVDISIIGDVGTVIDAMLAKLPNKSGGKSAALEDWWRQIEAWRGRDCLRFKQHGDIIKPQYALQRLYELTKERDVYFTTEVGQHQMWAAQFLKFEEPNRWMTSGGLGTMGYGFPAAMGVQVAHPESLVINVAGEASLMMNIQELSSMMQHRLPVKTIILNNEYMGMVRQWQELFHGGRYSESYMDSLPDFVKLAESFGANGIKISKPEEVDDAIRTMIETPGPFIADVLIDKTENVYPMIPGGAAHYEMKLGPDHGELEEKAEDGMVLV